MKIKGTYTFPARAEEVWDLLLDPQVLLQIIPGLQTVEVKPGGEIIATSIVGVGPVKGTFSGKLQLLEQQKPTHVKIVGEGKGGPGFMKGTCIIEAIEQDGSTLINYQADVQLGGTLASVGQRLVDAATNSVMQQGFNAFNRVLAERQAAATAATAEVSPVPAQAAEPVVSAVIPTWLAYGLGLALALLSLWAYFSHP